MQIALNIVLFVIGFVLAALVQSQPKQVKSKIAVFIKNLRYIARTLQPSTHTTRTTREAFLAEEEVKLLTRCDVESRFPSDSWQRQAFDGISDIVMGKDGLPKFPCVYATAGMRHNEHRWLFMPSCDTSGPRSVRLAAAALRRYLPASREIGPNTSLVIVFPPDEEERDVAHYQSAFWAFLRGLRTIDTKPWPREIPSETASPNWTFCFDGIPAFLAAMTPAHENRASRHAPNFAIAVQPRWVFEELFKTPEKRQKAVDTVRNLMPAYDSISLSPDLSEYGKAGTTESHQFYLLDKNETAHCPFADIDG